MSGTVTPAEPFALTESMLVAPPRDIPGAPSQDLPGAPSRDIPSAASHDILAEEASPTSAHPQIGETDTPLAGGPDADLLAPAVAAAAAASVGSLLRAVSQDRHAAVRTGGGPTIEDLVRVELGPLLKDWLATHAEPVAERLVREELRLMLREWLNVHLPPIVERAVRSEIERVVARGG